MTLHALWTGDALHLWGEATESNGHNGSICVAESESGAVRQHPYALPGDRLHEIVGDITPDGLLTASSSDATLLLNLPTADGGPIASIAVNGKPIAGQMTIRPYRIPTLVFEPADAVDLLSSVEQSHRGHWGASALFWGRVAQLVRHVLRTGQFVPDVLQGNGDTGSAVATWRICVRDEDVLRRLERHVASMPTVCTAVAGLALDDPFRLAESFVQRCGDSLIRRHLGQDPFFQRIHERTATESAAEIHWLAALVGERSDFRVEVDALTELRNQVRGWLSRVDDQAVDDPPALRLELCEPERVDDILGNEQAADSQTSDQWTLRFALVAVDGSERIHDAETILRNPDAPSHLLRPAAIDLREHLIAELQKASSTFAPIGASLRRARPTHVALSTLEAHAFLRDAAPLLESEGIRVKAPSWAQQPSRELGLRLHVRPVQGSEFNPGQSMGLQSIVDFEWQVAVGDRNLTPEEFERIRRPNQPLIHVDGSWIEIDLKRADQAAQFLESKREGRMTLLAALRMSAGGSDELPDVPVVGLSGVGWIERILDQMPASTLTPVAQPQSFQGDLRPYQIRGLSWLAYLDGMGIGSCLADDMGLGKTIQLIALLLHDQEKNGGANEALGPTLIFAPTSVVGNWQREIERFAPGLNALVHHGPQRLTGDDFVDQAQQLDVVITTYALGHRDLELLRRISWRRIVLDEAQKIKNPSAAQTIAIRSLSAPRWIAMTGTPLENHLSELWSIMEMINRGLLGSASGFRKRFVIPVERFRDETRARQLRNLIRPFMLRRVKSDPKVDCDLPEKMEMKVFCNLTPEQAALYEKVVAETLTEVEGASGIRRRGVILAALTKLKQACNHPVNLLQDGGKLEGRSGKSERLIEMLEEVIAEGDAALVFTQFRRMGDLLEQLMRERFRVEIPFLHGGVPSAKRQTLVDQFQNGDEETPIMLLSLRAGGLGLNLTRANHVFHFDRWWNPAVEEQATDRAHRIGQTRKVQVHKFVCIGTIEDRIDKLLSEKVALADRIVGGGDEWITSLSTQELREYLTLAKDAVG